MDSYAKFHPLARDQIESCRDRERYHSKLVSKRELLEQQEKQDGMTINSQFDMVVNCLLIHMINIIVNLHYRSLVTTSVAIVGRREHGHHRPIVLPLIPLHNKLMRSGNEVKVINMGELFCNVLSKRIPRTSW